MYLSCLVPSDCSYTLVSSSKAWNHTDYQRMPDMESKVKVYNTKTTLFWLNLHACASFPNHIHSITF